MALVIYDDGCGICKRTVRMVKVFDWLRVFSFRGYYDALMDYPQLEKGGIDAGVRVVFSDGSITCAVEAVRSIAIRTPLGFLPALLLYIPPIKYVMQKLYRHIADNRKTTSCQIHRLKA